MPIPNVNQTILDPGLGVVGQVGDTIVAMGTCSAGTLDYLYSFSTPEAAIATLGQGPLVELVCQLLSVIGRVYAIRVTGSVAGVAGSVTAAPVGTATGTITVAGAPYDAYQVTVEIRTTGTLGAGEFRYRLDKSSAVLTGGTWSETIRIPAGGTYAIPNTNLTLTFVPGGGAVFFEDGDIHTFTCTAPYYSTANWTAASAALAGAGRDGLAVLAGDAADASDAVSMFTAVDTRLSAMETAHQYFGALMSGGADTASNVKTAFAAVTSKRTVVVHGTNNTATLKPIDGWGTPPTPAVNDVAKWTMKGTISDDPARVATGAVTGVSEISHDERTATTALNEEPDKLTTMRTWVGEPGKYITNAWIKGPPGTDFRYIQHRRVMDRACGITYGALLRFVSSSVITQNDGTIDPRDKAAIEDYVQGQLDAALTQQRNLDNKPHVSAVLFTIDGDYNVIVNEAIQCNTAVRPLGYLKTINHTIGYTVAVGGAS